MKQYLQNNFYAQSLKSTNKLAEVIPTDLESWILNFQPLAVRSFLTELPLTPLHTIKNVYSPTMTWSGQVS